MQDRVPFSQPEPPPELAAHTRSTAMPNQAVERISLELSRHCNLACLYCYASAGSRCSHGGLTLVDARKIIDEAVALGAGRIVIVGGGEPFLHPAMRPKKHNLVDYIASKGLYTTVFTNGTLHDSEIASWLCERPVSVIGKLNSLDPATQDFLAGKQGAAEEIYRAIDLLISLGFNGTRPSRLGLETVICRQNYDELPALWRWMRERNIVPFVEIMTMQGRARTNEDAICLDHRAAPSLYKALFHELLRIDETEFGYTWVPHPPHVSRNCDLFHTNCYINASGGVQPCVGIDMECGYVRVGAHKADGKPLAEILETEIFRTCREIEDRVEEPCHSCDLLHDCYGCRGNAWNLTGSLFAGDMTCWHGTTSDSGSLP